MTHFRVKIQDYSGKIFKEIIPADSYDQVIEKLERRKLIPLDISEVPSYWLPIINWRKQKVTQEEIIELLNNMYIISQSGLPIHSGLVDLADDSQNKTFRNMLYDISEDVNQGISLHQAFSKHSNIISPIILNFIQIGEVTGQMDASLTRSASFLERITQLKKKTKSALIYPAFALTSILIALTVWLIVVLPQLTKLFESMGVELPLATRMVIALSDFVSNYIGWMVLGIVVLIFTIRFLYKRYEKVRMLFDKFVLKIPVIKHVVSNFNIAFITEYLRMSLISGVPMMQGLDSLKENMHNRVFKKILDETYNDITQGMQLSESLRKHDRYFAPFMLRMIQVGETTGELAKQLQIVSDHYYGKVDYFANNIGKIIEPAVLLLVGGFMAFIMIGLMGPLYDLIGAVK